jgi:ABC-2 type transport system permease protein
VLNGRAPLALVIPAGFGANALPGLFDPDRRPELTLLQDPSRNPERALVEGVLVPKVVRALAENAFSWGGARTLVREGLTNLAAAPGLDARDRTLYRELLERSDAVLARREAAAVAAAAPKLTAAAPPRFAPPLPYRLKVEALTARKRAEYNGYAHAFAGMGLQFVLMAMVDFAAGLLRERDGGLFRRLRAAPLGRGTLLAAKALSYAMISLFSLVGCYAFAFGVLGVRVNGSAAGFALALVSVSLFAAALALALAAVGGTPATTRALAIPVLLVLVMVGGGWVPAFLFPAWLQTVSQFTPTRWAVDALTAMTWRGLGFGAVLPPVLILGGWTVACGAVAWWRFRWETG